jgi:hypothetical protein
VQTATVHVTSVELLDLYNTPIEILPALPGGQSYMILSVRGRYDYISSQYATGAGDIFIRQSVSSPLYKASQLAIGGSSDADFYFRVNDLGLSVINQPVVLGIDNAIFLGDGTLDITIAYIIN